MNSLERVVVIGTGPAAAAAAVFLSRGGTEPLLLEAYAGLKERQTRIPADSSKSLKESADSLVQLYEAWGKADEVANWRGKLGMLGKQAADATSGAAPPEPAK